MCDNIADKRNNRSCDVGNGIYNVVLKKYRSGILCFVAGAPIYIHYIANYDDVQLIHFRYLQMGHIYHLF